MIDFTIQYTVNVNTVNTLQRELENIFVSMFNFNIAEYLVSRCTFHK